MNQMHVLMIIAARAIVKKYNPMLDVRFDESEDIEDSDHSIQLTIAPQGEEPVDLPFAIQIPTFGGPYAVSRYYYCETCEDHHLTAVEHIASHHDIGDATMAMLKATNLSRFQ